MAIQRRTPLNLVLDLGTYGMRLLLLDSASPGEIRLKEVHMVQSPKEFIVSTFIENPIMDPDPIRACIRKITNNPKFAAQNVLVMLPDHSALINLMIGPPRYSKKELEESIREDFTPIMALPFEQWYTNYQSIGIWEEDEITIALAIVLQNLLEVGGLVQETGLIPQVVDINYFNVANLLDHFFSATENKGKNIALVHLGNETTSIGVFRDGQIRVFSNKPIGGYDFTKKISKHFHVPESEADQFKQNEVFFLPEPSPEQETLYNFSVIKEPFSVLTREIFSTLESFLSKFREFNIHEIIISGGGANFQNLSVALSANINSMVRPVSDLYNLYLEGTNLDPQIRNVLAPACGAFFRE